MPEMVALGHARDRCGHDGCLAAVASTCCVRHAELHTSANPTHSAMYWPVLRSSLRCPLGPEASARRDLASVAPAATIAITGEDATLLI